MDFVSPLRCKQTQGEEQNPGDDRESTALASSIRKYKKINPCMVKKETLNLTANELDKLDTHGITLAIDEIKNIPNDERDEALAIAAQVHLFCEMQKKFFTSLSGFNLVYSIACAALGIAYPFFLAATAAPAIWVGGVAVSFHLYKKKLCRTIILIERFLAENNVKSLDILKRIDLSKIDCRHLNNNSYTLGFISRLALKPIKTINTMETFNQIIPVITKKTKNHLEKAFACNEYLSRKLTEILDKRSNYDYTPNTDTTGGTHITKSAWKSILTLCFEQQAQDTHVPPTYDEAVATPAPFNRIILIGRHR